MTKEAPAEAQYHRDPYLTELDVWVDALGRDDRFGQYLVLSDTLCHPHGGGQKGDRARLLLDEAAAAALGISGQGGESREGGAGLELMDTRHGERGPLHILGEALDEDAAHEHLIGAREFRLVLDWDFRYRQMRLHSLAHLLHCFVERVVGRKVPFPATSDIQPDFGLNRYEAKELLNGQQLEEIVERLNAFTAEGHPIETFPDGQKEGFRHWRCGEWSIPCGGTHPRNTAEIGPAAAKLSLKRGRTSMTFTLLGENKK